MNTITPRRMISDELRRRKEAYLLAVEPLVRIAAKIQLLQPIGRRVKEDGGLEWVWQYGWSEEAKDLYAKVMKEIDYVKDLYLSERGGRLHE